MKSVRVVAKESVYARGSISKGESISERVVMRMYVRRMDGEWFTEECCGVNE